MWRVIMILHAVAEAVSLWAVLPFYDQVDYM